MPSDPAGDPVASAPAPGAPALGAPIVDAPVPGAPPPAAAPEAGWHRLHPLSLVFAVGARLYGLRGLLLPGLLALVVSQRRTAHGGWAAYEGWLVVPAVLLLVFELVQYLTLVYRFDAHEIVIARGLFWKRERHIPYARVQNIDLVQHAPHRLAGVAVVRLDTGTGAGAEGELSVLSLDAVAELREAVRLGQRGVVPGVAPGADAPASPAPDAAAVPAPVTLVALDARELLLHGLLTGSGWVVVAAIAGALWQLDLDGWDVGRYLPSTRGLWSGLREATPALAVEIALLVALALLIFRVLAAVWSAVKHFDFALTVRGEELFQSYGLLTRVGRTIPRARIQKVTVSEEPLMRLLARATITIDTAASAQDKAQQQAADPSHVLVPIVAAARTPALVREVYPIRGDADLASLAWQGVDPRAFGRLLRVRIVVAALAGAASYGAGHGWALAIGLAVAAVLAAQAWLAVRCTAFAWSDDALWFRSGAWTRHVSLVRAARTQVVTLEQTPFDRRWDMAGVRVDTAGAASGGHHIRIRWLDAEVARALYAELRRASR